jgi:exosortase
MAAEPETKSHQSLIEEIHVEGRAFWQHMPDKALFFALLAVWVTFFHFLGNSVFGYIDTPSLLRWMYHIYSTSPDDGHGLLMPFVVVALLYWKRKELMAVPIRIWWPALGLVALALLVHLFGYIVQFPQVSIVGFFLGIYGLTGLVWGRHWLHATFFPMALFVFAVPLGTMGEAITFPMRLLAAKITSGVCGGLLGIDVIREGTLLFDSAKKFQYNVEAACGGIRSLIALLGISTVYAFVSFQSNWRRLIVILSAFPLAVAGNVFRLVCIIIAASLFGEDKGLFVHDNFVLSLLPYIPAVLGLLLLGKWLRERARSPHVNLTPS